MRIGFRSVDGVRVRCAESEGPAQRTVLLTSPWPESVYAFAPIWSALAGRCRLFAVDLPGFGASEARPEHRSPSGMGAFLIRLIDECGLGRPHLVGPDVGTSAVLFAILLSPGSVARYPDELPMLAARLAEIETPVMVFAGLNDRVVPFGNAEFLAARIRDSRLATFTTGHFVWEEQPEPFAKLLGDWIDEHDTTDGGS
jgi:pimeloyl-ACP methyl ester carboxylesterase